TSQWPIHRKARRADARDLAHAFEYSPIERLALFRAMTESPYVESRRHHVFAVITDIHRGQQFQAPNEQRGNNQGEQAECHLERHERLTNEERRAAATGGARLHLERIG